MQAQICENDCPLSTPRGKWANHWVCFSLRNSQKPSKNSWSSSNRGSLGSERQRAMATDGWRWESNLVILRFWPAKEWLFTWPLIIVFSRDTLSEVLGEQQFFPLPATKHVLWSHCNISMLTHAKHKRAQKVCCSDQDSFNRFENISHSFSFCFFHDFTAKARTNTRILLTNGWVILSHTCQTL